MIHIIFKKDLSHCILLCWFILFKFWVYGLVCQYILKPCYVSYKKVSGHFIFEVWIIECSLMGKKKFYEKMFFKDSVIV